MSGSGWDNLPADIRRQADTPAFESILAFNPSKAIRDVDQPILILQGGLDPQLPPGNAGSSFRGGGEGGAQNVGRRRCRNRRRQSSSRASRHRRNRRICQTRGSSRQSARDRCRRRVASPIFLFTQMSVMWLLQAVNSDNDTLSFRLQDRKASRPSDARPAPISSSRRPLVSRLHCRLRSRGRQARGDRSVEHERHLRQRPPREARMPLAVGDKASRRTRGV